jgi:hypothetical protein
VDNETGLPSGRMYVDAFVIFVARGGCFDYPEERRRLDEGLSRPVWQIGSASKVAIVAGTS